MHRLGGTVDDATGELDKVRAARAGLAGWAGTGTAGQSAAAQRRYAFTGPMLGRAGCGFSFSGVEDGGGARGCAWEGALPVQDCGRLRELQRAVAKVLADRATLAMTMMRARSPDARVLLVSGGVAANGAIRAALAEVASELGFELVAPPARVYPTMR